MFAADFDYLRFFECICFFQRILSFNLNDSNLCDTQKYNDPVIRDLKPAIFWAITQIWFLNPEDGTDALSRNVGKQLRLLAA